MKKRLALTVMTLLTLGGLAFGDIQSPPGHHYNWSRKLSRGVGNILYGGLEPFNVYQRTLKSDGATAAASDFFVEGLKRIFVRAGYGVYEIVTFPVPSYKLTYRPPYYRKENVDPWWGYKDFAPEFGFISQVDYSRNQGW
ncbi:MAG: exosortase system-associated protein, TIGR04073 family [Prosthecobacter sp.]|nr:exosortase system-associated protein, TIGR04073 family [Prosthecobacter sp.]